ncbi:MAG: ATP-binding protein [Desulfobacteraceae bacterium]
MAQSLIERFRNSSLKNKIFVSATAVILLVSVLIALFARWVLITTLTSELKQRGLGIGYSIAESSRSFILTEDIPQLTSLILDARLGARRELVGYVFISGKQDQILAHTFTRKFPPGLGRANLIEPADTHSIKLLNTVDDAVYDVAVAVNEGIYRIGSVHVGLYKKHIDHLIGKLRTTFLGFVSAVTVLFFVISHAFSKYITRPITELTTVSDEISRGNFDIRPDLIRGIRRSGVSDGPNPILVIDRQTLTILSANPSAEETYGYSQEELVGRPIADLGPIEPDHPNRMNPGDRRPGRITSVNPKMQYRKKNGETLYVNVHACPATFQGKEALIVAITDITAMVEKDSQLIQASKMTTLGEMSAGIAHELNQPLNAIKMGSEFLEMMIERGQPLSMADLHQVVSEISSQVDRAANIIRRLRDFGRKADFTKEPICINDPIQSVMEIIGRQLKLQDIDVRLQLMEDPPPILAHHNRIEQVIFNLLTNARDAINLKEESGAESPQRRIEVKSYLAADRVAVEIADTGIGIEPADRERIFEAFFTTKKMGEGMGLGLSITRGIVEDYGGRIHIHSTPGRGSAFNLSFPAAAPVVSRSDFDRLELKEV